MSVTLGVNLPVNDDVGNVNSLRPQLSGHALGQCSQGELRRRQIHKPCSAAQRRGSTGKDDDAVEFCHYYDQNCFDPNYDSEPLSFFEPILRRVMKAPRQDDLEHVARYGNSG